MNSAQSVAACAAVIDAADISSVPALLSCSDAEFDSQSATTLSIACFAFKTDSLAWLDEVDESGAGDRNGRYRPESHILLRVDGGSPRRRLRSPV